MYTLPLGRARRTIGCISIFSRLLTVGLIFPSIFYLLLTLNHLNDASVHLSFLKQAISSKSLSLIGYV